MREDLPGHRPTDFEFQTLPAQTYIFPEAIAMPEAANISYHEKEQLIKSLDTHRLNTLVELRRVERILVALAISGHQDVSKPMTNAWLHYVQSHSLLTELRALTRNYPFSAECIDEAKRRVWADPLSNQTWNFCWLVLNKIQTDCLIPFYAQYQASQPAMWGNRMPSDQEIAQLSNAFQAEWTYAVTQLLRHWDQPPTRA